MFGSRDKALTRMVKWAEDRGGRPQVVSSGLYPELHFNRRGSMRAFVFCDARGDVHLEYHDWERGENGGILYSSHVGGTKDYPGNLMMAIVHEIESVTQHWLSEHQKGNVSSLIAFDAARVELDAHMSYAGWYGVGKAVRKLCAVVDIGPRAHDEPILQSLYAQLGELANLPLSEEDKAFIRQWREVRKPAI